MMDEVSAAEDGGLNDIRIGLFTQIGTTRQVVTRNRRG